MKKIRNISASWSWSLSKKKCCDDFFGSSCNQSVSEYSGVCTPSNFCIARYDDIMCRSAARVTITSTTHIFSRDPANSFTLSRLHAEAGARIWMAILAGESKRLEMTAEITSWHGLYLASWVSWHIMPGSSIWMHPLVRKRLRAWGAWIGGTGLLGRRVGLVVNVAAD